MRQEIGHILDRCDEFKKTAIAAEIREVVDTWDDRSRIDEFDPFHSTVVGVWVGALSRALLWLDSGCDTAFLDFFDDVPLFRRELAIERPEEFSSGNLIHDSVRVVPVNRISDSARFRDRIQDCLPDFPSEAKYEEPDEQRFEEVVDHLDNAIAIFRELHPVAYEGFRNNIHTIYVAVLHSDNSSLGSRKDCYGSIIAGLSRRLIDERDYAFTASQLYHEHCHNKLVLYFDLRESALPTEAVYVSPFKNALRDVETIVHTVFPISMECITLYDLLHHYEGTDWQRTFAYLVAVGYRLEIIRKHISLFPDIGETPLLEGLQELSRGIVDRIGQRLDECDPDIVRQHALERERVHDRHAWDIGQFLCRGVDVRDQELSGVSFGDNAVTYSYADTELTACQEPARISQGNYGSYIESVP